MGAMTRYDVMKHWTAGFIAGIAVKGCDDSQNEHWQAGYLAGYRSKGIRNQLLDEYLIKTGREPQFKITIAETNA